MSMAIFLQVFENQSIAKNTDDDPYITKTFNLSSGELYVSTSGGSIRVEGGRTNSVKVEMYVKSNKHSDSKIREILDRS